MTDIFGYSQSYWLLGILSIALVPGFVWLTCRYSEAFGRIEGGPDEEPMPPVVLPPQSLPITPQQTGASGRFYPTGEHEAGEGAE